MKTAMPISKDTIIEILDTVKDPEIDTVSVIDLGMIENIHIDDSNVTVDVLPTFLGCPALEIIERNIVKAIKFSTSAETAKVRFVYHPPWTSDRITPKGHEGLKAFGIAPPPRHMEEDGTWHVDCPYCGSTYVTMENIFGPTACRSILYCKSCKNPFEAMKPISNI
ncbi:phenylacetate-CoA oxygenase subunit PaaJ [Siminovitchia terrae]|uniref:Phenylacetate-CoA oxygenase subunit PaaJ n=1 Tax=Siminovitchia terrae TaxID=1914933 RepID=A0A429X8V0_SIMTE|nr:1,2-phenylacetyl-CoA epoxidase subunit PaaD [Siminovitchia terrae]RST59878.1 phenylacetate-CoA oxygenase subunit PaaJ [Siminovitchia terrae]GIN91946.1 phenylacetate-CoA oxygenase subunit PaaJ [Siminovitchia terrae]GIN99082.1 phenylacetate-CoA oxygenase subunit PaaJ [Siminovitchia terrae]